MVSQFGVHGSRVSFSRKRLVVLASFVALAFLSGCATTAMKGTPFFTGERASEIGKAEDRVNVWPLLYYREPALSVLWPIGEYEPGDRLVIRPLFSAYNLSDEPEYNVLFPLSHFDQDLSWVTLAWWSDSDAFGVFPLYWHGTDFDSLFPLWIYCHDRVGTDLHLLWPLFFRHDGPDEFVFRLFPIFSYRDNNRNDHDDSLWWLAGLGGINDEANWFLPFYWWSEDRDESYFVTLPWFRATDKSGTYSGVPLLLSWREAKNKGDTSLKLAGGLFQQTRLSNNTHSGRFIPFYLYDSNRFLSLPYTHLASGPKTYDIIPPLLSWQSHNTATGSESLNVLAGLFHNRQGVKGRDQSWLIPIYYQDEHDGMFLSPIWAKQTDSWSAIPLLLSWQSHDTATGADSTYALGGIFHERRGAEGFDRDWIFPFYYRDEHDGLFLSPLWAHDRDSWSSIPPLLSWQSHDADTGTDSTYSLGGLFHRRRGAEGLDRDWLLPFYLHDEASSLFLSPLYAQGKSFSAVPPLLSWREEQADGAEKTRVLLNLAGWTRDGQGTLLKSHAFPLYFSDEDSVVSLLYTASKNRDGTQLMCIPALFSWQSHNPATGRRDSFALLGLFKTTTGMPEGQGASWLFPFYAYDGDAGYFVTPLFGSMQNDGSTERYWLTPLIGTISGKTDGWWVFPLCGGGRTDLSYDFWFLWGHYSKNFSDGSREASLFPLFAWDKEGDMDRIVKAMNAVKSLGVTNRLTGSSQWYYLCWLGGSRHRASVDPDTEWNATTSRMERTGKMKYQYEDANGLFPIWSTKTRREMKFQGDTVCQDSVHEESSLLLFLYDSRHEQSKANDHDYVRKRILWHLWHYEKLNGDVAVDVFPAMTYDRRVNGFKKTSFLWRVFRYEKSPEGAKKLDILFIPILRSEGQDKSTSIRRTKS